VLPFLTLTFAAALDFGRVYHASQTVQASAHAAVLYASGTATPPAGTSAEQAAIQAAVAEAASLEPPLDAAKVTVAFVGNTAEVTVTHEYPLLTSILGGQAVTITRSVTMNLAP
jgi:hypothetical protein